MSKKKKILITAGPVWVAIDKVRVITNIFGGALGVQIASYAAQQGEEVTLVFGPGRSILPPETKSLKIIRFHYFQEFFDILKKEISSKKYDVVIHSAAVSDYRPVETYQGKISSGQSELIIRCVPTVKIIDFMKAWDPSIFLIKFKLEVGLSQQQLIDKAYKSMLHSKADLMVANHFSDVFEKQHKAFIINPEKKILPCLGKEDIAQKLISLILKQDNA